MYKRLTCGLADKGKLIPSSHDVYDYIKDVNKDWYLSTYEYSEDHKKEFDVTGTVLGITDTTTNKIWFDFDKEFNPDEAKKETQIVFDRLCNNYNIDPADIIVTFSGNKGYGIELNLVETLTPKEVKNIAFEIASDLSTFDVKMYNASRILRIIDTKHQKTNLYKIPLSYEQLDKLNTDAIMTLAKSPAVMPKDARWSKVKLPIALQQVKKREAKELVKPLEDKKFDINDVDFTHKVKGWSNCKWSLLNGYQVKASDRHEKLLCIISQAKALNNTKENAYQLAKEADRYGVATYGGERIVKEDLWTKVESVYSDTWHGGTFTCKDGKTTWLAEICQSLGEHKCQGIQADIVSASEVFGLFNEYAANFDKNIITTGISLLDKKCKFMVGTSNGILAPPGVGKTTLSLALLNNNSNIGNDSIFFSYDMFHSMVYLRLIQKHFKISQDKIFDIFRNDKKRSLMIKQELEEQYKNVNFCFKSGQTADEIHQTILDTEQKIGRKVKLAMVDYSELVISPLSDSVQASAQTAQRLRQIANDTSTCVITLLQPSKLYSSPSDEITSYNGAKGSGAIAQAVSLMISLSRPGFSPRTPENDRFLTINALKNRQGSLFTVDLSWDGESGAIREMTFEEEQELKELRSKKAMEKDSSGLNF